MAKTDAPRIDHFFSAVAARFDLWRDLARAAQAWAASPASRGDAGLQAACNEALTALLPLEDFQAYPGARVVNAIKQRVAGGDAMGTARLVQRVSSALMSRSYRSDAGEFEAEDDAATPERAMPASKTEGAARPYFEVLFVTPTPPSRWPAHAQQIRKLRRPEDEFVYEPVFVGSFEDAALAVILNTNLESVVIYDGFPYESSRDVPLLKNLLSSRLSAELKDRAAGADGVVLAKLVKGFRPDLDIILLADRKPDAILADPAAVGHPPRLLRGRGAARDPLLDPLRRRRAQRHAVLQQPEEVRGQAGRDLPRAAGGAGQVDLQVELDPRHGRVLRGQPVPGGIVGDLRRAGQPARAHGQHQEGAGRGRARLRRRPGVLRDQRHVDLQQDGPPGVARAWRHRHRRSQLPQVAPLRHGARGRAAVLRRSLPDGGVLDVRRRAVAQRQEGACSTSRRRAGSTR